MFNVVVQELLCKAALQQLRRKLHRRTIIAAVATFVFPLIVFREILQKRRFCYKNET